jgi:hypothetical protein
MGSVSTYAPLRGVTGLMAAALLAVLGACSEGSLTTDSFSTVPALITLGDGRAFHAAVHDSTDDSVLLLGGQSQGGQALSGLFFAERINPHTFNLEFDDNFQGATPRVNPVALDTGNGTVVAGGQVLGVNNAGIPPPDTFAPAFLQSTTGVDGADFVPGFGGFIQASFNGGGAGAVMISSGGSTYLIGGRSSSGIVTGDIYRLDGTFLTGPIASLSTAREGHSATVLQDGTVLVVGGYGAGTLPIWSAEIFDPVSLNSVLIGVLDGPLSPRALHTATASSDGCKVFIFGGVDNAIGELEPTAEVFRSGAAVCGGLTERFDSVAIPAGIAATRLYHTSTLLNNGDILIVGGVDNNGGGITGAAHLFTPSTETVRSSIDSLSFPRYGHTATVFSGGVLIAGGLDFNHSPIPQAERYFGGF